jgi:hypothetical protein
MNLKAANKEYKIYSLYCINNYMINFKFISAVERVAKLKSEESLKHLDSKKKKEEFTIIETVILDLARLLIERYLYL